MAYAFFINYVKQFAMNMPACKRKFGRLFWFKENFPNRNLNIV